MLNRPTAHLVACAALALVAAPPAAATRPVSATNTGPGSLWITWVSGDRPCFIDLAEGPIAHDPQEGLAEPDWMDIDHVDPEYPPPLEIPKGRTAWVTLTGTGSRSAVLVMRNAQRQPVALLRVHRDTNPDAPAGVTRIAYQRILPFPHHGFLHLGFHGEGEKALTAAYYPREAGATAVPESLESKSLPPLLPAQPRTGPAETQADPFAAEAERLPRPPRRWPPKLDLDTPPL